MKENRKHLLIYFIISVIGWFYFVLNGNVARLGLTLFTLTEVVGFYLLTPKHKIKLLLLPIVLISLSYFINANEIWYVTNLAVIIGIVLAMTLVINNQFEISKSLLGFLKSIIANIFSPFSHLGIPLDWLSVVTKDESKKLKRILSGIFLSIPFIIIIFVMLSSADMVFSKQLESFVDSISTFINMETVFKLIFSFFVGSYCFGLVYSTYKQKRMDESCLKEIKEKDSLILNVVLVMILLIYTLFILIQFRYLFARGSLPYDFTYSEYARRGFFELLFLTGLNTIIIIYNVCHIKDSLSKLFKMNRGLLYYLCSVNVILLISSFYRMYLYSNDYGLTRLRLFVFGFLIFELIGLIATYFYIRKQTFNIVFIYTVLAFVYYIILVIVPTDRIIANNQINRYFNKHEIEIEYVTSLSLDAAPEIARLFDDEVYKNQAKDYFELHLQDKSKWQDYNYSEERAKKIYEDKFGKIK